MDKRINKSIEKIKLAYLELLFKEDPNDIQVKSLCKLAGVNRSTFYDRYGFLDALANEIIGDEIRAVSFDGYQLDSLPKENGGINKDFIRIYINEFCNNKVLMRFCKVESHAKYLGIIMQKQIEICTSELSNVNYYNAYFQVVGVLAMLIEWINKPLDYTLEDMVEIVFNHAVAMYAK